MELNSLNQHAIMLKLYSYLFCLLCVLLHHACSNQYIIRHIQLTRYSLMTSKVVPKVIVPKLPIMTVDAWLTATLCLYVLLAGS